MGPLTVLVVGLAVLIGISLGLRGGGGSILAVPLMVTAAAVAGALLGSQFTDRIPETRLRRAFGIFVLIMGGLVLTMELI